jgi:hypothetical protein
VTVREERLARLRLERTTLASWVIGCWRVRSTGDWFRSEVLGCVRELRELDAKIAHLTALTPFERQTIVRACQHIHGGVRSPLFDALHDVEARVKL